MSFLLKKAAVPRILSIQFVIQFVNLMTDCHFGLMRRLKIKFFLTQSLSQKFI